MTRASGCLDFFPLFTDKMADYWKSQPRKFCQYCKCWIADNKPSVEFHERGKNHKENVSLKIAEIKKKSQDKAKQDERMSKEFATMEEAAMKAYKEDLKRMQLEAGEPVTEDEPEVPPPKPQQPPPKQEKPPKKASKGKAGKAGKAVKSGKANLWLEGKSEDGHVYYYHSETGESSWERPEGFQEPKKSQRGQHEGSSAGAWMEALSPEGYSYYFNSETGESSWERPAHLPPPEEPSAPGTEPTPEREEPPHGAPDPTPAGAPEATDPPAEDPQVSCEASHKRKVEPLSDEAEGEAESRGGGEGGVEKKKKKKEEEDKATMATPPPEETQEEKEKREAASEKEKNLKEKPAKRPRRTTPYGTWEQIQPEEDPYANVDLQLPQVEEFDEGPELSLPPEPKPKFRERTITSLGGDQSGPAAFRKSKTHNGKARSLRQRGEDD
ncbi:unnamed protein product [Gadus morhua 'NCC']